MGEPQLPLGEIKPRSAPLSRDRRRTVRRRQALEAGMHPLIGLPLADNGETCGSCNHHRALRHNRRVYHKCALVGDSRGPGTDLRIGWPACVRWDAAGAEGGS